MALVAAVILLAAAVAGCGGSPRGIDQAKLEAALKADVQSRGHATVRRILCVRDGDGYHFACSVYLKGGGAVSYAVTCDASRGGACVWRPQ